MSRSQRDALPRFALAALTAVFALLLWTGVPRLGNVAWVWDNIEFEQYAQALDTTGHLPTKAENYEYTLPPGVPALAVGLERTARWIGPVDARPLGGLPRPTRAVLWLALVLAASWLLLLPTASRRRRAAGWAVALTAGVLGALDVVSAATSVSWVPGLLPDVASVIALPLVTALLARELWPGRRWLSLLAAFATMLFPVVFRIGLVFHPDPVFALLVDLALLLTVRARTRGWTIGAGAATGVLLAASALTRQSAAEAIVAIAVIALMLGRRNSLRFLAAGGAAVVLLAGPWWGYQANRFGNPIQSNLNRPGVMLDHEPLSFFVEVPGDIVTNPWRVLNRNDLFPKFHVGLWSDWSGIGDFGGPYGQNAKALASSQSVLGFGGDALVLGALLALGLPAVVRTLRRADVTPADAGLAAMSVLFIISWLAYAAMLIRFPQRDADPNSPHYLLFLTPAAALLGIAAAKRLWERGGWRRLAVAGWTILYTVSWAMVLGMIV